MALATMQDEILQGLNYGDIQHHILAVKLCDDLHRQVSQFSGSQFTISSRHKSRIKSIYFSFNLGLDLHPNSECRPAELWPISVWLMTANASD